MRVGSHAYPLASLHGPFRKAMVLVSRLVHYHAVRKRPRSSLASLWPPHLGGLQEVERGANGQNMHPDSPMRWSCYLTRIITRYICVYYILQCWYRLLAILGFTESEYLLLLLALPAASKLMNRFHYDLLLEHFFQVLLRKEYAIASLCSLYIYLNSHSITHLPISAVKEIFLKHIKYVL